MSEENNVKAEKRKFPRVTVPVYYRSPKAFTLKRRVTNISLGGVRIYSDELLKIGKRLEIEFFLPDGNSITATSRVVWIIELPPGSYALYDVGLEFIDLPAFTIEELKKALELEEDPTQE